jgi:hypothetical protein
VGWIRSGTGRAEFSVMRNATKFDRSDWAAELGDF